MLPGKGNVSLSDLKEMLETVGISVPNYKVRDIELQLRTNNEVDQDALTKSSFEKVTALKNLCQIFINNIQ